VNDLYTKDFPKKFITMIIENLRSGSIVVESSLYFNSSAPDVTEVNNTFANAKENLTFKVLSISVTQIP
ncbi:cell wall protein DAN4-like, partial [Clarias magur]